MAQAKKKKSTKTAKRTTTATKTHKKSASRSCCKAKSISPRERMHVYIVTVLSIAAGILLCADMAIMAVA